MGGMELCAALDSGAGRRVLPFHQYNAIPENVRPQLQLTCVETLYGVGPGGVQVLGKANIIVCRYNRKVSLNFLAADITSHEVLPGHPFLTQAGARLDCGKHRIVLYGDEMPDFHPETARGVTDCESCPNCSG